jgi:hypothetical protein
MTSRTGQIFKNANEALMLILAQFSEFAHACLELVNMHFST